MNGTGSLIMRAEKIGSDTMLARIVAMVAEAQRSRAPIQRMADMVSGWFVPAVIVAAVVSFIAWAVWGPPPALAYGLIAAVSVLIIACPCALGLATPMSIMVGVGKGAMGGVLIRSAEALERMEKVDTLVVDKTGTLTEGKPRVVAVVAAPGMSEATILLLAASLERSSEHPLAAAIVAAARDRSLALKEATGFASVTGKGVTGSVDGHAVALGNAGLMEDLGVELGSFATEAEAQRQDGGHGAVPRGRWQAGRCHRDRRSDQSDHAGSARRSSRGQCAHRDADRRQSDHGRGSGTQAWHRGRAG